MKIHARDFSIFVKILGVSMACIAWLMSGMGMWEISALETSNYILAMQLSVLPIDISKIKLARRPQEEGAKNE